MIFSSNPSKCVWCFLTSCGSKLPLRSRGTSIGISPVPLRELPDPRPDTACFSYPRCSAISADSAFSTNAAVSFFSNPSGPSKSSGFLYPSKSSFNTSSRIAKVPPFRQDPSSLILTYTKLRTPSILPIRPGLPARMTHDYVRHGTTSLFAALEVATGTVSERCFRRHTHQEFLAFLKILDRKYRRREIHLICDNYGTHKHPVVRTWLAEHPRFHLHLTPTSASWLNLVERWFARITQEAIRRGTFTSVAALERAILLYTQTWNENPKPFVWTKTASQIRRSLKHAHETLVTGH